MTAKKTEAKGTSYKRLFDKLYAMGDEAMKAVKKPRAERKLKRELRKFHTSAIDNIEAIEEQIEDERHKLDNMDVQKVIDLRGNLVQLRTAVTEIEAEFTDLFNTNI